MFLLKIFSVNINEKNHKLSFETIFLVVESFDSDLEFLARRSEETKIEETFQFYFFIFDRHLSVDGRKHFLQVEETKQFNIFCLSYVSWLEETTFIGGGKSSISCLVNCYCGEFRWKHVFENKESFFVPLGLQIFWCRGNIFWSLLL